MSAISSFCSLQEHQQIDQRPKMEPVLTQKRRKKGQKKS